VIIIGLLSLSTFSILAPNANASNSLVGYWKFDEGTGGVAADSSGNGNGGTVHGASWTTGISDVALQFDGVNDYVGIADSPSLRLTSNQASLELWFKPAVTLDSTLTHRINILDKGNGYGFQMEAGAGLSFTVWIGGNQWLPTVTNNWIAGEWYYITGTYDGTTEKVYVNGILENSQPLSGSLSGNSLPLSIGSYCYGTMNFFNGAIDEVKVYDYARTAQQILDDYNSHIGPRTTLTINVFDESGFPPASIHGVNRIADMPIKIYKLDDSLVASGSTDASGTASFNLANGQYKIVYGSKVTEHFGVASKIVDVSGGSMNLDIYSFQAQFHTYSGGGPYELDHIDLDKNSAGYQDVITVQPGQQINAEFSWWELETVNVPVWYVSAFGSWNPTSALGNLAWGCASPWSHNLYTIPLTFTAPSTPGTYEVRLVGVLDYDWPNSFYTAAHYQPSLGRDTGISIIGKTIDGPYGVGTIIVRSQVSNAVTGIETVVHLNSYTTVFGRMFSIQQNLWIYGGSQEYWAQNVILVWPFHMNLMTGLFEVYNKTAPSANARLLYYWQSWGSGGSKDAVVMRSVIEGGYLVMSNDFSSVQWQIPSGALSNVHIESTPILGLGSPEIVIVGGPSLGPLTGNVAFEDPTSGSVDTYVRIGTGQSIWLHGVNSVIGYTDTKSTAEYSQRLLWHVNGQFEYAGWSGDQGLWFGPDENRPATPPPVPTASSPPKQSSPITMYLQCPVDLSIFDKNGNHLGYNSSSGLIDENIQNSWYLNSSDEQAATILDPQGDYNVFVIGKAEGNYTLRIERMIDGETVTQELKGTTVAGQIQAFGVQVSETGINVYVVTKTDINPHTLNLRSKGEWITAYLELPEGFDVHNINVSSVLLNNTIPVAPLAPMTIGDHDNNGVPDLMVKFDRAVLESWIYNTQGIRYGNVTLTITGELLDETPFRGTDVIFIKYAGDANNDKVINIFDILAVKSRWAATPDSSNWIPEYNVNGDETINIFDVLTIKSNWGQTTP
jgi:hypothetical protein